MYQLPVADVLDEVVEALRETRRVILSAPPGSGKTTLVPPALLRAGFAERGQIVLAQPRRVAAKLVARRIASGLNERLGGSVGYQVRFERRVGPDTRIRVVTEGILTAELQRDPALEQIGVVILDEFHERSLDADLALAFVKEVQEALRPELCLVVMSATLDPAPLAAYLEGARRVEASGRLHPVRVEHVDKPDARPPAPRMAAAVRRVVRERGDGDILAFLPGAGEIERTRELLTPWLAERRWEARPLYGALPPRAQEAALSPGPRRRVILATNIAETSLTIEGVTAVVDSGLRKVLRHDPALGVDRLSVERISRASAEQRAGRAGRLGPGYALRLWTAHEHRSLAPFDAPELQRVDLGRAVLELRRWGVTEPRRFAFFEAPSEAALERAEALLELLGATNGAGTELTRIGRTLAALPAHPRVARFLLAAADNGLLEEAALVAALLGEPDVARGEVTGVVAADVLARRDRLQAGRVPGCARVRGGAEQLVRALRSRGSEDEPAESPVDERDEALCRLLLEGWPDRLCRRVRVGGPELVMVGGRGAVLARHSGVRDDELLLALEVDAGRRGERSRSLVKSASRVAPQWLAEHRLTTHRDELRWDPEELRVKAWRTQRFGDLVVREAALPLTDREGAEAMLLQAAEARAERALAPSQADERTIARVLSLGSWMPELGLPAERLALLEMALPLMCVGRASFAELREADLGAAVLAALTWQQREALDRHAPLALEVPSGRRVRLAYTTDGPPVLAAKVQELFGWLTSPRIAAGRQPVRVHLLDPAGRPLQMTTDLDSFWTRTWPEVRREMRARYPKHHWPEDPLSAEASCSTLKPGRRRRRR